MALRLAKASLVAGVALFFTLVVFNNLTDYASNHQFVRHVLSMDTTFPGNRGMWRAIDSPALQTVFYWSIIAWETLAMVLCWWGAIGLLAAQEADVVAGARGTAIAGLSAGLLLWLVAFLDVGGEWFLLWQSTTWNGQAAAFRMFAVEGIVLLILLAPAEP